jgi:hypothetical protein
MRKPRWNEDNLKLAISKSKNIKEVLEHLSLVNKGKNYITINKWIQKLNLDISHFETFKEGRIRIGKSLKKDINSILIKNSNYSSSNIKERLFKENIKERKCELCGQDENWKGKKMSLILDHIDGDHLNNELINLRIVCPNCNATLDTHCRGLRNKKREYIKKENRTRTIEQDYSYLKEKIECIDFNKRGWRLIMGGKLNITPQRAGEIIKKYFPEIWEKAYKHLTTK